MAPLMTTHKRGEKGTDVHATEKKRNGQNKSTDEKKQTIDLSKNKKEKHIKKIIKDLPL